MAKRKVIKRKPRGKKKRGYNITPPYELLGRCASAGLIHEQIAAICGVKRNTLQKWLRKDKQVYEIIRKGKEEPNLKVENSLYRRALGYNIVETTEKVVTNGGGVIVKKIPIVKKHKHVPASVKAIEVWLYNRDPDRWKKQAFLNVRNMSLKDKTELANGGLFEYDDND